MLEQSRPIRTAPRVLALALTLALLWLLGRSPLAPSAALDSRPPLGQSSPLSGVAAETAPHPESLPPRPELN